MTLQTILFGDFNPPPIAQTRVICRSGFYGGKPYLKPKEPATPTEKPAYKIVRKALAKTPRITTEKLAKSINMSGSYVHRVLCELRDKGEVGCTPGPKPKSGGNTPVLFFLL